jgi:hypothetical protein
MSDPTQIHNFRLDVQVEFRGGFPVDDPAGLAEAIAAWMRGTDISLAGGDGRQFGSSHWFIGPVAVVARDVYCVRPDDPSEDLAAFVDERDAEAFAATYDTVGDVERVTVSDRETAAALIASRTEFVVKLSLDGEVLDERSAASLDEAREEAELLAAEQAPGVTAGEWATVVDGINAISVRGGSVRLPSGAEVGLIPEEQNDDEVWRAQRAVLLRGRRPIDELLDAAGYPGAAAGVRHGLSLEQLLEETAEQLPVDDPEHSAEDIAAIRAIVRGWLAEPKTRGELLSDPGDDPEMLLPLSVEKVDGRLVVILDAEEGEYPARTAFWIENRELIETGEADGGGWDWENGGICDPYRGQDPALQQYVRDLLTIGGETR